MKTKQIIRTTARTTIRITTFVFFVAYSFCTLAQSIHSQVYDAQTAIAKKDWAAAETILNKTSQLDPNNPHVLYELAQVYEHTNRLDDATKIYQSFSQIPDAKLRGYIVLARSADGIHITNLADLTQQSLERITAKQAMQKQSTPQLASAPIAVVEPVVVAETPKAATIEPIQPQSSAKSTETALTSALQKWTIAWANKDLPNYFASYVGNFQGDQASSAAWMKSRSANISNKKIIELDLSDIQITALSPTKAQINFKLKYVAGKIKELSSKSLLMTKIDSTWLIEKEAALK
jgi:tetratricopeptide (TPR) repeat protein